MTDVRRLLEEERLRAGLTQRALALALGVTQPHYSKVVGGVVPLTGELAARMSAWMENKAPVPAGQSRPHLSGTRADRARRLALSIARDLRELSAILRVDGKDGGRLPKRTRSRAASPPRDPT